MILTDLNLDLSSYTSASQKIRILSENWVGKRGFCPSCGSALKSAPNNSQALDFNCSVCDEEFELKAKSQNITKKIVNGAYDALTSRVESLNNPNLYLLQYNKKDYSIDNFLIIPRYFFTKNIIEKRKPLGPNARRAGWVGCNILIGEVPQIGRIFYIKDKQPIKPEIVLNNWKNSDFIKSTKSLESRGWLLDTLSCVERLGHEFSLEEIYKFETELKIKHPDNNHIKDKLRQQLQFLRDKGIIEFTGRGNYRKISYGN